MKNRETIKPPRLAEKIFGWYCRSIAAEDLQGDMDELFVLNLKRMTVFRAKGIYWKQTLSLIFSYALRHRRQRAAHHPFSSGAMSSGMLRNYVLTAFRNLARHRMFTILNVLGLAIGMSIGVLYIAMISFLWTYDDFHINREHIYRIISRVDDKVETDDLASAPPALADRLEASVTGIDETVRIQSGLEANAVYGNHEVSLRGYVVDPSFLQVFTFPLLKGNPATALVKSNSILITEKAAKKLFGDEDAYGKVIALGEWGACEITGILKDHPRNSHLQFEILGSYATLESLQRSRKTKPEKQWKDFSNAYVYLKLSADGSPGTVNRYLNSVASEVSTPDFGVSFQLQPMNDIVLGSALDNEVGQTWDYQSMSIFLLLTLLILIPACFNYANISISRALKRMKEIGLRKVMGGATEQIFVQFIMETIIITLISLVIAFYIFTVIREEFVSMLVGGAEALSLVPDGRTIVYFILFAVLVGFSAGAVPALYFSRLSPIAALKSKSSGTGSGFIRKMLLVAQFALSLGFIMSVVITFNQYRQSLSYDFGFSKDNILDVDLQGADPAIVRSEFSRLSTVSSISMSSHIIGMDAIPAIWVKGRVDSTEVYHMAVDENYIDNFGLSLIAGANFETVHGNARYVIVNEEFVRKFKLSRAIDAPGHSLMMHGNQVIVLGVVRDFHYAGLRQAIQPFFFQYNPSEFRKANLKMSAADIFGAITEMERVWRGIGGETKFKAKFFDDELEEAYAFHFSIIKICGFLGLLAISISCLGLLGMVVFTVENRVREIGIRKAMGASTGSVIGLLSMDFVRLMLLAAPIAAPLTYLFFDKIYLRNEYYKIPIGAFEIITSCILMVAIGLVTILSQTAKAAAANPVDSLRNE